MPANDREAIRKATVSGNSLLQKTIEIGGVKVEIRAPQIKERAAISRASKVTVGIGPDMKEVTDFARFQALMVVASSFVPGTMEKVYGPDDVDTMMASQAGSWFDLLQVEVMALVNPDNFAKNSKPTLSSSAS